MTNLKKNLDARRPHGFPEIFAQAISFAPLAFALFLTGCAATPDYVYRFVPGKTAILRDGVAIPPPDAPRAVHVAIAAGNRIAGRPYRPGGGHRRAEDIGYDCSGAVSYILGSIGALRYPLTSHGFRRFGLPGFGRWITVYAKRGHVFLVVAGLRFDTGWVRGPRGPQWTIRSRPAREFVVRHPPGL